MTNYAAGECRLMDGDGAWVTAGSDHSDTTDTALTVAKLNDLAGMLTDADVPAGTKITVTAGKVACRASNVDITAHSCDLTFGGKTAKLAGRAAHELYATLLEVGVEADPGAGNIWVSVSKLNCAIDVDEVKDKAGGGAKCEYASNG